MTTGQVEKSETGSFGWAAVLVPNAVMMYNHAKGRSPILFNTVIKYCGIPGLFALPFLDMMMEKSFYDTSLCLRAIDPNAVSTERKGEGFPNGGHALPSLSLVPLRQHPITLRDLVPTIILNKER